MLICSFSAAYQSFVKTKKPQHLRLSIMQAQEILQHESKFYAKYGRRLSTDVSTNNVSNADSDKQTENQASRFSHASTGTSPKAVQSRATVQQLSIAKTGHVKGVGLKRDQRESIVCDVKREENIEKRDYTSHDQLLAPAVLAPYPSPARRHDDNPTDADLDAVESRQKGRSCINEGSRVIEARLQPKQEESLKRQKEKEQTENHERERVKFLKELEDKERQKIITEYLHHVYSHHGQTQPQTAYKKGEHDTRPYKVSKQGRVYSMSTRPQEEPSPDVPHLITSPAPIWHQTARGSQGDKKISFRAKQGVTGTNGVRFFNEWNNSLFTDYINSSDGKAKMGKEKDKLQDPSYWIEQHLDGVLDETSVRRGLQHHQQLIPRET
ncbi:uncharacterized protein LOC110067684 [Orbicella faveolata]|uniref:uncharacterized protein LOC110067684 n=1 Tax=Orbicella faveolata TaxID=48498 RepID=UPI0009E530DA|nr:uncharacterized protein LOC110067684 [Orbicella faveolata]